MDAASTRLVHQGGYASFPQPEQPDDSCVVDVTNLETYLQHKRALLEPPAGSTSPGASVTSGSATGTETVMCSDWTRPLASLLSNAPLLGKAATSPHCTDSQPGGASPAQLTTHKCQATPSWAMDSVSGEPQVLEVQSAGGESVFHRAPLDSAAGSRDFVAESKDTSSSGSGDECAERSRLPQWLRSARAVVQKSFSGQWRSGAHTRRVPVAPDFWPMYAVRCAWR